MAWMWTSKGAQVEPIFRRLYDERLADFMPDHERLDDELQQPATTMLPEIQLSVSAAEDMTHTDYLAQRTDNGLRPEDAVLEQPPQDPNWRPDVDS